MMMPIADKTISENISRNKRGRPRLMVGDVREMFQDFVLEGYPVTERTLQNTLYKAKGLKALIDVMNPDPALLVRWEWLLRPRKGQPHVRTTIMYQLGRTKQVDAIPIFADQLCQLRPTATEAVRLIREWQGNLESVLAFQIAAEPNAVTKDTAAALIEKWAHRVCKTTDH